MNNIESRIQPLIHPERKGTNTECRIIDIQVLAEDPQLKKLLTKVDTKAYGKPGNDPFYESYSSNLVVAEKGNEPVGFISLMTREVNANREGAFIGKLREFLLEFRQPNLPDAEKIIFVNNIVSIAPGVGSAMFRELREGFSPAMVTFNKVGTASNCNGKRS